MPLTTPPLAPKTLAALHTIGIHTLADLQLSGAVKTFLLLKATGLTLTRSSLWQLAALTQHTQPQALGAQTKLDLLAAVRAHPPVAIFPAMAAMEHYMQQALNQAALAAAQGEIPVGAVVVCENQIIAVAHNTCVGSHNISHHAEINALAIAGVALQNYRLEHCDVYITLEPCAMCASALIQARVRRVIYGAAESKTGAAGSVIDLFSNRQLNQHTAVYAGVLANECQNQLHAFFQSRR